MKKVTIIKKIQCAKTFINSYKNNNSKAREKRESSLLASVDKAARASTRATRRDLSKEKVAILSVRLEW